MPATDRRRRKDPLRLLQTQSQPAADRAARLLEYGESLSRAMHASRTLLLIALAFPPLTAGCGPNFAAKGSGKIVIAVTIVPHGWLVQQIGGDRVEVVTMVTPGESAELYQPTDAQITQLAGVAACFRAGMPLEESRGFRTILAGGAIKVVDLREGIRLREMTEHSHPEDGRDEGGGGREAPAGDGSADRHRGKDPHIWLSPRLLIIQARAVAETLAELDPTHREEYSQNLAQLQKELGGLDQTIRKTLAPFRGRAFFVYHPAWGYFADEYGLRQIAVETEGKEPSDRELTDLQRRARKEGAKVIFIQKQIAGRAAKALAEAIGGRTEVLGDLEYDVPASLLRAARLLAESYGPARK